MVILKSAKAKLKQQKVHGMLEKGNKTLVKSVLYIWREQEYSQSDGLSNYSIWLLAEYFQLQQITHYVSEALLIYIRFLILFPIKHLSTNHSIILGLFPNHKITTSYSLQIKLTLKILNLPQNIFQQTIIFAVIFNITKISFHSRVREVNMQV